MIKPKLLAKAAIFDGDGKLLILTRSDSDRIRPGLFDFPGGGLEADESPTEAMIRELKEETGILVKPDQVVLAYSETSYYDQQSTVRFLFVCHLQDRPEIKLSFEHDEYTWMTIDEAYEKYDHPVWIGGLRYLAEHNQL